MTSVSAHGFRPQHTRMLNILNGKIDLFVDRYFSYVDMGEKQPENLGLKKELRRDDWTFFF